MSAENKNKFVMGSFIFGKGCYYCSGSGITCSENGLILSEGAFGQVVVHKGLVESLKVPGKLQNCKIASGHVSFKNGVDRIKTEIREKVKDDTRIYEELATSDLDLWSQSK